MESTHSFSGKVCLVTGGASGIGRAAALRFAVAGGAVVVADRAADAARAVADEIVGNGGAAESVAADVTSSADVERLVEHTVRRFGSLDCAFNNAGIEGKLGTPAAEIAEEDWNRIIGVNLTSVWLCMKYELAQMVRQGSGTIVNTSSTAGLVSAVNSGVAYAASKHGVVGLTKTAAKEYLDKGIRINAVCPGGVATPLLGRTVGDDAVAAAADSGLIGTPDQIADAVLWLSSPASAYVNGHALVLDGARVV